MKNLIFIFLIIVLFSCQERKPKVESIDTENLTQVQIDSILSDFKFQYEPPIVLDSTEQILIPISTKLLERRKSFSKNSYYSDNFPRYWNILFYNRSNGKTKLLTENKFRISGIYVKKRQNKFSETKTVLNGKILYKISDIDYNKDRKLNNHDPEFLFVSELDGTKLKRISPINEDLIYYEVLPKSKEIIIKTMRDVNNDSIFNDKDDQIWYKTKIVNQKWKIEEIVDSINRKKIEKLYFKQWLNKK